MTKEAAFLLCYFKLISWAFFHLSPGSLELFPIGIIPLLTNNLIQDMNRISNQILRINLSLGLIRTSDSAKFLTLHVRVFKTFFFFFKTCLKLQSSQITFFSKRCHRTSFNSVQYFEVPIEQWQIIHIHSDTLIPHL